MKLFRGLFVCLALALPAFTQTIVNTQTISTSGNTIKITNTPLAHNVTWVITINNTPATAVVTASGCDQANNCTVLWTRSGTSTPFSQGPPPHNVTYNSFRITASWTGGSSPNVVVVTTMAGPATGSTSWGQIGGTLANQTDLNTALGLKAPLASPALTGTVAMPDANTWSSTGVHLLGTGNALRIDFGGGQRFEVDPLGFFLSGGRGIGFNTSTWFAQGSAVTMDSFLIDAEDAGLTNEPAVGLVLESAGLVPVNHQNQLIINQAASNNNWDGLDVGFDSNDDAIIKAMAGPSGTLRPIWLQGKNCLASNGTCGRNAQGSVSIAAGATTVTVATAAVTAGSQILVTEDSSLGTALSVTCNTTVVRVYAVTARTAGTSFVITSSAAPSVNPACLSFQVIN